MSETLYPVGYYNRNDPTKNYDRHLFVAGAGLQSAELNEIQDHAIGRVRGIADALFSDGDVIRDAQCVVNRDTGDVTLANGAIYVRGAVRGVPPASFIIPTVGVVNIGIYLTERVITALEDPSLLDPANGTRNYQQPGAARLQVNITWGFAGDGKEGEFFPVYTVEDGDLRAKEPPPQLDSMTQAIAKYDRDSAGGSYVVSGLNVRAADDLPSGEQVYTVSEGSARVGGMPVSMGTSKRLIYAASPDEKLIDAEPHVSSGPELQRVTLDRYPVKTVQQVRITAEKTATITHGSFSGAQDPLPDNSVVSVLEVKQGGVTYVQGTDFRLTAGKIDWSLTGAEPAPGSTYTAKYQYIKTADAVSVDSSGFSVEGAVAGSLILVTYIQLLPRIDRLALNPDGAFVWLNGVAAEWNPKPPAVPLGVLPIATVVQTWTGDRRVVNDGVRVVPMNELAALQDKIDWVAERLAEQQLSSDVNTRESGAKNGVFVDPFLSDEMRDQGTEQTAAIFDGELTIQINSVDVRLASTDVAAPTALNFTLEPALQQLSRTGSMKVNPYMAFDPIPAAVTLTPALDRWTETSTSWTSPITRRLTVGSGNASSTSESTQNVLLSTTSRVAEFLRQIDVQFRLSGFGPNETLSAVTFDGIAVTPTAV